MLDLLFKNASVVDGSGGPARTGDVGVKGGRLTFDTGSGEAGETVDCRGLTLCPGFIDAHSHGDLSIGTYHAALCKICQGVTTEIGGQCGQSGFPVDARFLDGLKVLSATSRDYLKMPYEDFIDLNAFAQYAESQKLSLNMALLVGHNSLRISAMGVADREPDKREMELMRERLKLAMEQGAFGMSSGLIYIPGAYSRTEELIELCKVMAPYGGVYATHMRNEAGRVTEAVRESVYIAEQAGVPLVISHHKICGRDFWGKSSETLEIVKQAADRGVRVMLDQYPYEANMTGLNVCIPPRYFSEGMDALLMKLREPSWRKKIAEEMNDPDGGYDNFYLNSGGFSGVFVSVSPNVPEAEGMMLSDYAKSVGKEASDAYFDLLIANKGAGNGIFFAMDMDEVRKIYLSPYTVAGSDGLCYDINEKGHPRAWGTFIRPLAKFAQEEGLLTFEEAVRKQTSQTAEYWALPGKGRIAEGFDADLVLLDRTALRETATFRDSNRRPEGIRAVYVAGRCAYDGKDITAERAGRIVRRTAAWKGQAGR